jgi:hypothetical protein
VKRFFAIFFAGWWSFQSGQAYVLNYNGLSSPQRWNFPGNTAPTNSLNRDTDAIRFYLASDGYSANTAAADLNAIRATFAQWQSVSNTIVKFEDAGLVPPQNNINISDGTNTVFFAKGSIINGEDISGVLGRTYVRYSAPSNLILEADIMLNAYSRTWFADFGNASTTAHFIEAVCAHEMGHFLGLGHSPVGCASMSPRGPAGMASTQMGLSSDEILAVQDLYAVTRTNSGSIHGTVTKNGIGVLGAQVFFQDNITNDVAGVLTRSDGTYSVNLLPPGTYYVRVAPLDPNTASRLVSGPEISPEFNSADTAFMPTTNITAVVIAGSTNVVNFAVENRTPPFRITHIRNPTTSSGSYSWNIPGVGIQMVAGQSNYYVGVGAATFPSASASLAISGNGLTLGSPIYLTVSGIKFMSVLIGVSSNATPGMRTITVRQYGTNVAHANAFLDIQSPAPDFNFDGLDDTFQREFFPLFTAASAGPNADPDGDGANNRHEYVADTNPTNAASVFKVQSLTRTNNTNTVRWTSIAGRRYQVSYRTNLAEGLWMNIGTAVTAAGPSTSVNDTSATNLFRTYRVQHVP